MAINPVTASRVTHRLQTGALLEQLRANSLRLFNLQQQLSTGRRLLTAGDDPVGASRVVRYDQLLTRQDQILANLTAADKFLSATDAAITDVSGLLIEAAGIASEQVGSFQSADQRAAAATLVDGIITQLEAIGNREFQGRYLFAGRQAQQRPLDSILGRVTLRGDRGDLRTRAAIETTATAGSDPLLAYNLTVDRLFDLASAPIAASADLDPILTSDTRIADLGGALGQGVRPGTIRFTEQAGPDVTFDVDSTGVDTVGDLIARFNQAALDSGSTLTLSISGNHLRLDSGGGFNVVVADVGDGFAADDLGLTTNGPASPFDGADTQPALRLTTGLADLYGGAGLALASGVRITNGGLSGTVTFAGATTVQDVINRLNSANLGIQARINDAGTGIDVLNLVSGADLRIGENGGNDAARLGIRTLNGSTRLADLNGGRGVTTVAGDDLLITDGTGLSFGVDLSSAVTVDDVIAAINAAAAGAGSTLTAGHALIGNGLRLGDASGTTTIRVERANLSAAADDLGLLASPGTATELIGADVHPRRASGVFSALYELRDSLLTNDTKGITSSGEKLASLQRYVASVQGGVGSRAASVRERISLTEDAVAATRILLSEVKDVDFTEAVTRFQQAQVALQANLQTGSAVLNLSLLDFLQ